MIPTIVLVHHSYTPFDEEPQRIQSWSNLPLNEHGVEVAKATAEKLRHLPISHVVASPMHRAKETGEIIADAIKRPLIVSDLIAPWNKKCLIGQTDGMAKKVIKWFVDNPDVRVPGGEKYRTFFERLSSGWDWLKHYAEANPENAIVAVTHSEDFASLDAVETRTLGDYNKKLVPPYGGYWVIQKVNDKWLITGKSW